MRRLFGCLCGASGGVGVLLCVAGIVGCWRLEAEIINRADVAFGRAELLLIDIGGSLDEVSGRMRLTELELTSVRQRETEPTPKPGPDRNLRRSLSRKGIAAFGTQVGDAKAKLNQATEIGLVVNGLLEVLSELPLVDRSSVDTDKLKQASDNLTEFIVRTDKLAKLLGDSLPEQPPDAVANESSRMVNLVGEIVTTLDDGSERAKAARLKVAECHARIVWWTGFCAVVLTLALVWIAAGQLSLLIHGRSLVRMKC